MTEQKAEAYQFFSRRSLPLGVIGRLKAASSEQPEINFDLTLECIGKPFDMAFAQLRPQRQSIGAYQYVDLDVDAYFSKRWPICLKASGTVRFPLQGAPDNLRREQLLFLRRLLWEHPNAVPNPAIPSDQRATIWGYRREFFNSQLFDILGTRRPSDQATFVPTEIAEPIGPGVADFPELDALKGINELVWSQILPFAHRSTFDNDKTAIRQALTALQKQYNSYSELDDSRRHLQRKELKASVRSAASAVDAYLRHLQDTWAVKSPPGHLPFDEKIEHVLRTVNKPSYKAIEPNHSRQLLYLYRARNTMHEGDCFYNREDGQRVRVIDPSQVEGFIVAVESFVLWADSVV